MANTDLIDARKYKKDEFYTLYENIEKELKYYKTEFENKIIYCNCDDFNKSNFFKYFYNNFKTLNLKQLITTSYNKDGKGLFSTYDGNTLITRELKGDGSFLSEESIILLKEADIIVTNPPFSLARDYINQLTSFNKQFIMMGNINMITYQDIFPLIINNKIWFGYKFNRYDEIRNTIPKRTSKYELNHMDNKCSK